MIIQISNIVSATTFLEILEEQGYEATQVSEGVYHVQHDRSVQCRNLCADLLDEGFRIELLSEKQLPR